MVVGDGIKVSFSTFSTVINNIVIVNTGKVEFVVVRGLKNLTYNIRKKRVTKAWG